MGKLADAFKPTSAYAAKKTTLWPDLCDRIAGAMYPAMLDEFWAELQARPTSIPSAWWEPLAELIEKRREELAADDVSSILRDHFDF